ncbi:hypothetical protein [Levilactobacillus acidifarinae]|uniref:hypothetical protein n=1 Tax=Levilactobacillus acidifarinae TaxID=267364 RepID=UPI00070C750B|nr:hypothetical protein [Levilactobacillus acidifarinae]MCG0758370.1 hypothetical protein [Lactiplantibacillus plantarum]GEO70744.1 hypothetical protein LAC03_26540 [Levilactobacillus acidifarinae]
MKSYRKYIIAVMTVLLIAIGLTACGKSTAQDLQSNNWYLNQKGQSYKTQFNKKAIIIESPLMNMNGTYSVSDNSGKKYLKVNTDDEKNQTFELTPISDGYKAKAINKSAKADNGLGSFELQKRK